MSAGGQTTTSPFGLLCQLRPAAALQHGKVLMRNDARTRISSAQIRAARGLLDWSARELSQRSGVSKSTIHRAESSEGVPSVHEHSLAAIKAALEECGIDFLDDSGVRLRFLNGNPMQMAHTVI